MSNLKESILLNPLNLRRPNNQEQIRSSKSHYFRLNIIDYNLPCILCGLSIDNEVHN